MPCWRWQWRSLWTSESFGCPPASSFLVSLTLGSGCFVDFPPPSSLTYSPLVCLWGQVTNRECPPGFSDLVDGLGRLQHFVSMHATDALHDLTIQTAEQYVTFLRSFEPPSLPPPAPLPSPVSDDGQLFSRSLLTVKLRMEVAPPPVEGEAGAATTGATIMLEPGEEAVRNALRQVLADAISTMATFENTFMKLSGHPDVMFNANGWRSDRRVEAATLESEAIVQRVGARLAALVAAYQQHVPAIFLDEHKLLASLSDEAVPLQAYAEAIEGLKAAEVAVLATSANAVFTGVVRVECGELRAALCAQAHSTVLRLQDHLQQQVRSLPHLIVLFATYILVRSRD
jgi:hypothetical protein